MPTDLRTQKLAKLLVRYSVNAKPHESILISGSTEDKDILSAIYKEVILAGAHPVLRINLPDISPFYFNHAKEHQLKKFPDHYDYLVKNTQKSISINTVSNTRELSGIDSKKITQRAKVTKPIKDYLSEKNNWCLAAFPCTALAQEAEMSLNEYERLVFNATIGVNWIKLRKQMQKIKSKFKKNSLVHLIGENIDLRMRVQGDKAVICDGKLNMPGGEIFMAPLRESLNGKIKFDFPAIRSGKEVTDIELEFKDGKVIKASASKNEDFLKAMLATDEGSSYVGELGIGCNPNVTRFTKDLLFDEKIGGTIHMALGSSYPENTSEKTKNDSAIHWDIVKSMKNAKIIVDNKIIQENGVWKL